MAEELENIVKLFGVSNQLLCEDLSGVERAHDIQLGHETGRVKGESEKYYSQFEQAIRTEAARMSIHFEVFYCLERSIRNMISEALVDGVGDDWWDTDCVPSDLRKDVSKRIKTERDTGMTRRSDEPIDYTTFGELSKIILVNWNYFGSTLSSQRAVERILSSLNSLRGPIAHCCPLAEDEEVRLQLALRDWFRQME